jgi:putative endonuclease
MQRKEFAVYIMASRTRTLYVGVTSNLPQRVRQHKCREHPGFSARYNVTRLVYFEFLPDAFSAINREKQIKGWTRAKRIALIESKNPEWIDLPPPDSPNLSSACPFS